MQRRVPELPPYDHNRVPTVAEVERLHVRVSVEGGIACPEAKHNRIVRREERDAVLGQPQRNNLVVAVARRVAADGRQCLLGVSICKCRRKQLCEIGICKVGERAVHRDFFGRVRTDVYQTVADIDRAVGARRGENTAERRVRHLACGAARHIIFRRQFLPEMVDHRPRHADTDSTVRHGQAKRRTPCGKPAFG